MSSISFTSHNRSREFPVTRAFFVILVIIFIKSNLLTAPVVAQRRVSRYETSASGSTPFPANWTINGRKIPDASDQSFIFRPFRQFNFTINVTVPVAALVIPDRGIFGPTEDVANQALFLVFGALVLTAMFAVPLLFTGTRPFINSDIDDNSIETEKKLNRIVGSTRNYNYMDVDMQNLIGINPKTCLQKTICEAHRYSDDYKMLAVPFQLLFPPAVNGTPGKPSPFRIAAADGQGGKVKCGEKYNCFFDFLDVALYFVDWWRDITSNKPVDTSNLSPGTDVPADTFRENKALVLSPQGKYGSGFSALTQEPQSYRYIPNYPNPPPAFLERRIFNVSVPTFTPMFDFKIPDMGPKGGPLELTNQFILGSFAVLTYAAAIAEPILVSSIRPVPLTGRESSDEGFFSRIFKPRNIVLHFENKNMTTQIGIDGEKCLQKSICEAHRYPESYGLISLVLRMFYPPPSDNATLATATPYQMAARDGVEASKECNDAYHCFFDPLDLTLFITNWWKSTRDPDQLPLLF